MARTRLSIKGQVVIPREIRTARSWHPGLELMVEETRDGVLLKPVLRPGKQTRVEDIIGCARYQGRPKSLKEMSAAVTREARRHR